MTNLYVDSLDYLIEEGIFLAHADIIRDALRRTFRAYGIEPFRDAREIEREAEKLHEDFTSS